MKVLMTRDVELAKEAEAVVTVEAEYGTTVVEGSKLTLAHHVPGWDTAPVLNSEKVELRTEDVVLISHIDLDTIMGIASLGEASIDGISVTILEDINYVDCNGQHRMSEVSPEGQNFILSYIGYVIENPTPRIGVGEIKDVTEYVTSLLEHLPMFLEVVIHDHAIFFLQGREREVNGRRNRNKRNTRR